MSADSQPSCPRLSVVVPTYQRRDLLERTLRAIVDQDTSGESVEVVVAVDGSTDGTVEMLAEQFSSRPVRVLRLENAGPAAARNAGIRAARGDLVLLLDDDILCPPGLVAAHLEAHRSGGAKVVFGPILGVEGGNTASELTRLALEAYYQRMRDEWHPDTSPIAYVAPNTSVPRDAVLQAGAFDVRFARAHEDADLGLRLRATGLPFEFLANAPAYELYTKSAQQLASVDATIHGHGEVTLCRAHPSMRRHSFLRVLGEGGALRRSALMAIMRSPVSPDWVLRPAFEVAERLPVPALRRLRLGLLARRGGIARLRAAAAAAGGCGPLQAEFGARCPALLYHHVGPMRLGMPPTLTITPQRFDRQMRFLHRRGFTVITAGRWLAWLERGAELPKRPVILTFDDAFADLEEHAFPTLHRYGFGATVFVVTGRIGGSNDWDRHRGYPRVRLLDQAAIRTWSRKGIEFGAHSRTHCALDSVHAATACEEIQGSRSDLESLLGVPVRTFAYPYGVSTPAAAAAAAQAFGLSFGCMEGVNTLATDPHDQRRTMVQPTDTLLDIEFRARFGWSPLSRTRAALRLGSRLRAMVRGP